MTLMEFHLLHAGLAAGAATAALPVILHLVLRQKPRREPFPALRLVRQRHRVNLRKLRLRHWLLLAMRMLILALMALALARPSIHGASFIPDQQAPVAAALVFDTSLSMEYREQGRTRLEAAQQIAGELLREFPDGSEVMVLDAAETAARFFPQVSMAAQRVESLRLRPAAPALNQAIAEACLSLKDSDRSRKEIYVFTDRAAACLAVDGAKQVQDAMAEIKTGVAVYVLDVGIEAAKNASIDQVTLSADVVPANTDAVVETVVADHGQGEEVLIELEIDDQPRGKQSITLDKDQVVNLDFPLPRLAPGVHQGKLILRNGGGLEFDDERFLTVEVRPVNRVLIASDIERDALRLRDALAPPLFVEQQIARHQCDWAPATRLGDVRLADYSVVCLVNVRELPSSRWQELESFVRAGGGLAVFLGARVSAENYNQEIAQGLLPLKLGKATALSEPVAMQPATTNHPVVAKIEAWDKAALSQTVVERYIVADLAEKNTRRVLNFTDGAVALAERTLGGEQPGKVVVFTSTVSGAGARENRWNDLPLFAELFVPFADHLIMYLAGHAETRLNYTVGDDVILRADLDQRLGPYLLTTPDSKQPTRGTADPAMNAVVVARPEPIGNYMVTAGQGDRPIRKGFSVNAPAAESRLGRLSDSELAAVFGEGNFAVARTADELREVMGDVRIGRELFPWLMPLILLIFAVEHWLANRFYDEKVDGSPTTARRRDTHAAASEPSEPRAVGV
jgi:hypothetical protein